MGWGMRRRNIVAKRVGQIKSWPITGYDLNVIRHHKNDKRYLFELLAQVNTEKEKKSGMGERE